MSSQLQDFLNTEPLNIRNTERRSCMFAARFLSPKKAMNHRKHPRKPELASHTLARDYRSGFC